MLWLLLTASYCCWLLSRSIDYFDYSIIAIYSDMIAPYYCFNSSIYFICISVDSFSVSLLMPKPPLKTRPCGSEPIYSMVFYSCTTFPLYALIIASQSYLLYSHIGAIAIASAVLLLLC